MKYDPEYDSYRFSGEEIEHIVNALKFYILYSPSCENYPDSVDRLINDLKNSCNNPMMNR